ncbi:MAG TPA: hypothetical protein VGU63_08325 [Candidatus Acidoferrales bacterium]|nr:hypothetical protein [Candidatus Acidoferrales bacterium]
MLRLLAVCLTFTFALRSPASTQKKRGDCSKPPEVIPPPKQPKGKKQSKAKVYGAVVIEISEDGDVVDAKAVHPTSLEVANQLVSLAKSMKFKPRPGCGVFKTVVTYNIGD